MKGKQDFQYRTTLLNHGLKEAEADSVINALGEHCQLSKITLRRLMTHDDALKCLKDKQALQAHKDIASAIALVTKAKKFEYLETMKKAVQDWP